MMLTAAASANHRASTCVRAGHDIEVVQKAVDEGEREAHEQPLQGAGAFGVGLTEEEREQRRADDETTGNEGRATNAAPASASSRGGRQTRGQRGAAHDR